MLQALKNAFGSKVSNEAAIMKTATIIKSRTGNPEATSLEDAVYTVISNITLVTKRVVFERDMAAAGKTPKEAEYLMPSVLLGMLLTQKMWGPLEEKYDGGRVASYVAARHCLDNPTKHAMTLFTEGAMKYNLLLKVLEEKGEEFKKSLMSLIDASFANADNDSLAEAFTPIYLLIRDFEKEMSLEQLATNPV